MRVVPRAEKKMEGAGETAEREAGHWEESVETRGCSLVVSVVWGTRRARAWMEVTVWMERRVVRMWEPCVVLLVSGIEDLRL